MCNKPEVKFDKRCEIAIILHHYICCILILGKVCIKTYVTCYNAL